MNRDVAGTPGRGTPNGHASRPLSAVLRARILAAAVAATVAAHAIAPGEGAAQDVKPPAAPPGKQAPGATASAKPAAPATDPAEAALQRALAVEEQLVGALSRVRQSSVTVLNRREMKKGDPPVLAGSGSGVLVTWKSKTWVITNDHVIAGATALEVITADGRTWPAKLADTVKLYDISLLQLEGKTGALKPVPVVTRASKEAEEGQWVLATGSPFSLAFDGRSVATLGVISGKDRVLGSGHVYGRAIQHDAAVNPGNSGGPLWNLRGELVGINGMIASRGGGGVGASNTGASFTIPIDQIQPYLDAMADAKKDAQAGFLGIDVETATDAKGTPNGARISRVDPRGPARLADTPLSEGDRVLSITVAGKVTLIQTASDVTNALSSLPAGTALKIRVNRNGKELTWSGKLGAQP